MPRSPQRAGASVPVDLACAALAAAGLWYSVGPPSAPFEISDWTWVALGVGALLSLAAPRLGTAALLLLAALGWAPLAFLSLQPLLTHHWPWPQGLLPLGALVVAGAATAAAAVQGSRVSARGLLALLAPWSLSVAAVLAATGSLLLGQLALCAAAPALLCALLFSRWSAGRATLLPVLLLGQLTVVGGLAFSSTPRTVGLWLLLSPLALYGLDKQTSRSALAGLAIAAGALLGTWWAS